MCVCSWDHRRKRKRPQVGRLEAGFGNCGALCRNYKGRLGAELAQGRRMLIARGEEVHGVIIVANIIDRAYLAENPIVERARRARARATSASASSSSRPARVGAPQASIAE